MPVGTVKFFDRNKNFGYVVPDERGGDVYLWGDAVTAAKLKNLKAMDRVEYEIGRHPISGRPSIVKIGIIEADQQERAERATG